MVAFPPAAGVAVTVNVVGLPATALAPAVIDTVGTPAGATTTCVDAVAVPVPLSVAVTDTGIVPAVAYTCST